MDYGSSRTTINPRLTDVTDDYLPHDENDYPQNSRKTVTIQEPSDMKTSARETEPLLFSQKPEN